MAASPLIPTVPNTPLLNRQSRDDDTIENIKLPNGACNYTNLNVAGNGPKCGCRRFFDKAWSTPVILGDGASSASSARSGFCMCEHHACFHDHGPDEGLGGRARVDVLPESSAARLSGLPDAKPETGPPNDSDLPDTLPWGRNTHSGSPEGSLPAIPSQCLLPSDQGSRSSGSQAISSRPFAGLGLKTLSHIPLPRPSALGTNFKTQGGSGPSIQNPRPVHIYVDSSGRQFLQSLTDAATPRSSQATAIEEVFGKDVAGINDALDKLQGGTTQAADGTVALRTTRPDDSGLAGPGSTSDANDFMDPSLIPRLRSVMSHVANYPITMQNHEQRIALLEDGSFHNPVLDEVQEMHEHMDTRVAELETRVADVEKTQAALNDVSSVGSRARVESSFDSRISNTSSALISAAMERLDSTRFQALEAQVAELQASAPPTHLRPWEVEVVFIPYGRRLMGIWTTQSAMKQKSRGASTGTMDWAPTQNNSLADAQASLNAQRPDASWESAGMVLREEEKDSWLSARACGVRSKVYERLRSRGLVRSIQVKGPDARDVQAEMISAFGDLSITLTRDPFADEGKQPASVPESLESYLGLQAPWLPLRKLHKDSSLRFLTPSEMVTPALWTVAFLSSSVAMRSTGIRRLFVTQADSYMQHTTDTADWTWQKLRQLPRFYPEGESFGHTPEADAQEPCWAFDAHLDPLPSAQSSIESQHSLSIRAIPHELAAEPSSPSDHFSSAAVSPRPSKTPDSVPPPLHRSSPNLRDREPFRPIRARTTSAPSLVPLKPSHSISLSHSQSQVSKRRQASPSFPIHQDHTQSSPILGSTTLSLKRRRTRSPSRPRDTPRWSVGPPSPYTFMDEAAERERGGHGYYGGGGNGSTKRATTPFAYATPHSNTTFYGYVERPRSGGAGTGTGSGSGKDGFPVDEEDDGFEHNALTDSDDFEQGSSAAGLARSHGIQIDEEEWHGVQESGDRTARDKIKTAGFVYARKEKFVPSAGGAVDEQDDASERSSGSTPSEYPSTKQPKGFNKMAGSPFRIHVDEEEGG